MAQIVATVGQFNVITFSAELFEHFEEAGEYIQIGRGPDIPLVRRETVDEERDPEICTTRCLQTMPALKPPRDSFATVCQRRRLDTAFRHAAEHVRFGSAVNFR